MCLPKSSPILLNRQSSMFLDLVLDGMRTVSSCLPHILDGDRDRRGLLRRGLMRRKQRREGTIFLGHNTAIEIGLERIYSLVALRESLQDQWQGLSGIVSRIGEVSLLRKTSHASDKVYALLGMIDKEYRIPIAVDYRAHYMSVYQDYIRSLWTSDNLRFLGSISYLPPTLRQNHYPSWVADLSQQSPEVYNQVWRYHARPWTRVSRAEFSNDAYLIFAEGVVMGEISYSVSYPNFSVSDCGDEAFPVTKLLIKFFSDLESVIVVLETESASSMKLHECIMKAAVVSGPLWKSLLPGPVTHGHEPFRGATEEMQIFPNFWLEVIS